ncbi:2-succinyl-6-hydroxy-2,4-cyclohexadiene-1-carboxylate synthase [Streptomyces sp. RB5]|uniref:2-succinyl-6-hydroxy-2, 4-cyclohexadiene-1-carboxylate synthase n=1 Tax=Streptomyces smaragdinus TaxID=2585196 RepID=A0A7K0CI79_9ACTN|nr:alpha/beta hydrolase [Streptomyces smaragdinus]MQY13191.1 2-succinyl-6-hydroxy-2,4-cyclohexadiene-1-carboxylate synthase [Streptomyces smaragdinus]
MRDAVVTEAGDRIRWAELAGEGPARVYLSGLGATAPAYWAGSAAHPLLAGRRSLLVDMLGFGVSDRPADFDYSLESHADAVAAALRSAGVSGAEVIGHSMGGAVAIVLAARHPELVARLLVVDGNLDALVPTRSSAGSRGIASYAEEEFVHGGGWEAFGRLAGAHWWATIRLCGRRALYRSAVGLTRGSAPVMRELLLGLEIPRTFLWPEENGPFQGAAELEAAGVRMVPVADCGHNIMLDNPDGFARAARDALGVAP